MRLITWKCQGLGECSIQLVTLSPYSLACFHLFSAPLTRMLGTPQLLHPDLNGHLSQAMHQDMASNVPVAYITQDTRKTLLTPLKLENTYGNT